MLFHSRRNREYWKACKQVQTDGNITDIQQIPMGSPRFRRQVETFLSASALRLESVEDYFCILREDGSIAAGAGLSGDLIKCVAVDPAERSKGLIAPLVSHIIGVAAEKGITNLKVFTKPENEAVFTSLGFHTIARAPLAILLENGHGLEDYLAHVSCHPERGEGSIGVIIMNANPFTLGHKYLVEKAFRQVDKLFVIPVKEDLSLFPYSERLEMIRSGCEGLATVLDGSDYQISAATFPTYFLKDLSEASETQMLLDLDMFGRHIAPALGATVRFVGSEPTDPLTARYNELMKEVLPTFGISVVEIPRLVFGGDNSSGSLRFAPYPGKCSPEELSTTAVTINCHPERSEGPASATLVRKALQEGSFRLAAALTPTSTWPYLVAELMARALRMELDTPLKPGLVDKDSNGAHSDMDYALMSGSIEVIRRSFIRHLPMLLRRYSSGVKEWKLVVEFGKAIEADVMEYTWGVNTYRGAIFALGLAAISALDITCNSQLCDYQDDKLMCLVDNSQTASPNSLTDSSLCFTSVKLSDWIANLSGQIAPGNDSHGANAVKEYGVKGALQLAQEGYKPLFEDWLPFYRGLAYSGAPSGPGRVHSRALRLRSGNAAAEYGLSPEAAPATCPDSTADIAQASIATLRLRSGTAEPLQKTLLRIMSTLDDTCVIHRVGYERAQEVKIEAKALLEDFSEEGLIEMKKRYDAEGISPGGAADMLALTILIDSLTNYYF